MACEWLPNLFFVVDPGLRVLKARAKHVIPSSVLKGCTTGSTNFFLKDSHREMKSRAVLQVFGHFHLAQLKCAAPFQGP